MTTPTAEPSTTAPRARSVRRALDDLGFGSDRAAFEAAIAESPVGDRDDRQAALERWTSLPAESNLLYTPYIDLRAARLADAKLVRQSASSMEPMDVPDDADGILVLTEGDVTGTGLSARATAAGVVFTTLADLWTRDPDAARNLLAAGSLPEDDKFAQLTQALWSQAVVLDVPAGVTLDKPLIVRWALGTPDRALLTRTIVRLGDGAAASLVDELVAGPGPGDPLRQAYFAGTTEVTLGAVATLSVASLQELPPNVVAIQHRTARIGEAASLQWALAQLGGRLVRSRVDNRLVGDRSSVEQVEIVFGSEEQLFDLTSYTTHIGRDTTGDLLSKGALLDRARTYMKGLITIEKSAVGTDSFLGEFGMNLSKATRSVAIPSLEIDQPDCRRAAHSSSVGPIDETQLFYLESRGIPPDDARKFIVLGFLEPVVARVPLASAQARLRDLLEEKWATGVGGGAAAAA